MGLSVATKPIEQIQVGDKVATRNPETGKTEFKRVVAIKARTIRTLFILALADKATGKVVETITTTPEHPFNVAGRGFTAAINLAIGNAIVTRAGPALLVQSITPEAHPEGVAVYNFEVEDDHTYFVGTANGGTWVHNDCLPKWLVNAADRDGFVTIGRGLNAGETFGPGGITKSGWPAVHATTDLQMAGEIAAARNGSLATTRIRLTDLERLVSEGKIHLGHNMRELRLLNGHLDEIANHLHK